MKKQNFTRNFFMVAMLLVGILATGFANNSYASGYIGVGHRTGTQSAVESTESTNKQKTEIQTTEIRKTEYSDFQIVVQALFKFLFG